MEIEGVRKVLEQHRDRLREELGVAGLSVFGSVARGEAARESDIDVLVDFEGPADFSRYMELKERLEGLLKARVDLVTRKGLRPALRPIIEKEAIRVA